MDYIFQFIHSDILTKQYLFKRDVMLSWNSTRRPKVVCFILEFQIEFWFFGAQIWLEWVNFNFNTLHNIGFSFIDRKNNPEAKCFYLSWWILLVLSTILIQHKQRREIWNGNSKTWRLKIISKIWNDEKDKLKKRIAYLTKTIFEFWATHQLHINIQGFKGQSREL